MGEGKRKGGCFGRIGIEMGGISRQGDLGGRGCFF